MRRRVSGLTLGEVLVLCAIVLVICSIAIPGLLSSQRASNERGASASLKTLSSAEADFRANDRDWNHISDFWTADVKGLYTLTPAGEIPGSLPKDQPMKLIHLSVAAADGDGTFYPAAGENLPLNQFSPSERMAGFWYMAMVTDQTLKGPEATYKVETGGTPKMGAVHNTSKFGFVAFPDSLSAGKYAFLLNENNTIFREALTGNVRLGNQVPPGPAGVVPKYLHWPDDSAKDTSGHLH